MFKQTARTIYTDALYREEIKHGPILTWQEKNNSLWYCRWRHEAGICALASGETKEAAEAVAKDKALRLWQQYCS